LIRDLALLLGIIALHALALLWLAEATRMQVLVPIGQTATQVAFVSRPKPLVAGSRTLRTARTVGHGSARPVPQSPIALGGVVTQPSDSGEIEPFRVLDSQGRVLIAKDALDAFLQGAENKSFEVGRDGQDDLRKLVDRPVALEYRSTRFDDAWQGDKPPLTRVLETAVEKTTATIRIPVPGRPGAFLQCKIMVLAAGGGCGFTANDDGYYVLPDDPDTLSPEEDRQCQAWWDLIVSAKTQGEWRRTRTLYDNECRKPLLHAQ
jgi:hypothetical protein